jgi:hypothetical protein
MSLRDQSGTERKWLPSDNLGMQLVALTFGWICGYRAGWVRGFGDAVQSITTTYSRALRRY